MNLVITTLLFVVLSTAQSPPTLQQAQALMQKQDYDGAIELLRRIVDTNPKQARAVYLLGHSLHAKGDFEEAIEWHIKASRFPQMKMNGSYNAACAFARLEKADEALAWLGKAVRAGFADSGQAHADADLAFVRDDGGIDFLLTSAWSGIRGTKSGRVFIVAGPRAAAAQALDQPGDQRHENQ